MRTKVKSFETMMGTAEFGPLGKRSFTIEAWYEKNEVVQFRVYLEDVEVTEWAPREWVNRIIEEN